MIVALHGGSYSSAFFDIAGYSLLDRAAAAGCPTVAFDRPGYGHSTMIRVEHGLLEANAQALDAAIAEIWDDERDEAVGVVLVGHSIGAAVAILIAAGQPDWPILGIAISGIGLTLPRGKPTYEGEGGTPTERMAVPDDIKNALMFGPPGTFDPDVIAKLAQANEPVVFREIIEINEWWPESGESACSQVRVPVLCRQGEFDALWSLEGDDFENFRRAFSAAPFVDAMIVPGAAHNIDFHYAGHTLHNEQIAFAMACAGA